MNDIVFFLSSLAFFIVALVYQHGCQSLKGGRSDD